MVLSYDENTIFYAAVFYLILAMKLNQTAIYMEHVLYLECLYLECNNLENENKTENKNVSEKRKIWAPVVHIKKMTL